MNPYYKPLGCIVRKTKPIGPFFLCENYCNKIIECIKLTKAQIEQGFIPRIMKKRNKYTTPDPQSRCCSICHKPLARASTRIGPFKGMLGMHLKSKHPEIQFPDLFYIKDRIR